MSPKSLYLPLNVAMALVALTGAAVAGGAGARPVYLIALFALCTSPLLVLRSIHDRFALLATFFGIYFLFYGFIDLLVCLGLADGTALESGPLTATEALILVGGGLFLAAYRVGLTLGRRNELQDAALRDWPERSVLIAGVILWLLGSTAIIALNLFVVTDKTAFAVTQGFGKLGPYLTALLILGNYLPTLGIVTIAYGYATSRRGFWLPLVIAMLVAQVFLGLLADIKGIALSAGVMVVLVKLLVDGRIPWRWVAASAVAVALIFPVLQAYRAVLSESDVSRGEAAKEFGSRLSEAFAARKKVTAGRPGERAQTVFERSNLKPSVQLAVDHSGRDVAFQRGATLVPLLGVLVPRLFWQDKPDVQVGILFNKEFRLGAGEDTYISPSHLGELYWNWGWPGACLGMVLIGALFGWIGARCDLSRGATVTRVLVLLSTVLLLGFGFESSIATLYSVWIRTMLVVGLLHLALARPITVGGVARGEAAVDDADAEIRRPFPNVLP